MFRMQFNAIHGSRLFNQLQWVLELNLPRAFLQPCNDITVTYTEL